MRERLSMALFKRMGLIAEREAHARLYINNTYVGLFTIVESLDKTFLTKNFNENDGHLYEYSFDNAAALPFDFGYPGSDPALYSPAPFKPETLELDPQGEVFERLFWTANVASDAVWRNVDRGIPRHAEVHPPPGDRELPRRRRRPDRRLRAQQLLLLPLRRQEPVHVPALGQEQHVLGEPVGTRSSATSRTGPRASGTGWWCGR